MHESQKSLRSDEISPQKDPLKQQILTSQFNLKRMHGGKRLSEVLGHSVDAGQSQGLPVFKNRAYSTDLQSLLQSRELQHSFRSSDESNLQGQIYQAIKLAQEMEEQDRHSTVFLTDPSQKELKTPRQMFQNPSLESIQREQSKEALCDATDEEVSYRDLNQKLRYPMNPAYLPIKQKKQADVTLLETC